jgi:hypothetical protein
MANAEAAGSDQREQIATEGRGMEELPEEAVLAAAQAIFEHSMLAGERPGSKARQWLDDAGDYQDIARVALMAALPYLRSTN